MKHVLTLMFRSCFPCRLRTARCDTTPVDTPVPPPTSTPEPPTPMPLDLTVLVVDRSGAPICSCSNSVPKSGAYTPVKADDKGSYRWTGLKKEKASLKISAQGYNAVAETLTLAPGANEYVATLVLPPHAFLASQACASDETFVYAEDFQDGKATGFTVYPPGWAITIEPDTDVPDNMILLINFEEDGEYQFGMEPPQMNVVWRLRYKPGNSSRLNVGLGKGVPGYFVVMSADEFSLNSYSDADGRKILARGNSVMGKGVWHFLEFSSYNGHLEVWADGVSISYDDAPISNTNKSALGLRKCRRIHMSAWMMFPFAL